MKKIIPLLLQSLVTLGLLVWIFWKADFRAKTWEELAAANPVWLAAGFGAAGVVNFLGAFRWGIFLRVLGVRLPAWQVLRLSFVGLFFNIFLVGAVGGDAVKVVWLVAKGHPKTPALLSVFMDRMSGFGAMVVCSLLFIFLRLDWLMRSEVVADVVKAVLAYLFCAMALMAFSFIVSAKGFTGRLPRRFPGRQRIIEFTNAYFRFITSLEADGAGFGGLGGDAPGPFLHLLSGSEISRVAPAGRRVFRLDAGRGDYFSASDQP